MLAIFKELGNGSPVTQKYRKLMQRLLYWDLNTLLFL
jgi:thioredoxin-like negative regulator of GroEL